MKYGLLGHNLGHSYSPRIHHMLGNEAYELFELESSSLPHFFSDTSLAGLNVTIPYKVEALKACHHLSERAERIGCVNTMIRKNGQWYGDNTDYDGFIYTLSSAHIDVARKQCLILGDGATASTIHVALEDLGASEVIHVSRHKHPHYDELETYFSTADIIINATPVGMYPNCPDHLINLNDFTHLSGVIDLVYNPLRTTLLIQAERLGIPHANGLPFLVAQAIASSKLFLGQETLAITAEEIIASLQEDIENIILVGMPGVGKTTVGKALAQATGRNFIDIDEEITKEIGPIPHFIETRGEKDFRQVESIIIERFGKQHGLIISTGGGAVTVAANFAPLRQNGRIFQITQPVDQLATNGRPLSAGGLDRLKELERIRTPMYKNFAQCIIEHHKVAPETVTAILQNFKENLGK